MNQLQTQGSGNLPAQTIPNPNVSSITLRSGEKNEKIDKNKQTHASAPAPASNSHTSKPDEEDEQSIPLPFPQRAVKSKKMDQVDKEMEILDIFKKVEVNIPLLEAIKQIPKYAKFLKEICTNKRKLKGKSRVNMSRNVSAIIQQTGLPKKCEDPGVFTIPCTIGDIEFGNCMLDLGSSINVMPTSVYNSLCLGPLQPIGLVIQLANKSITRRKGVVEDVLFKINDLIFPADLYILDMQRETSSTKATFIFGRPFFRIAGTKIDVYAGTLSMEFGDNIINFNIFDAMKHPNEEHSLFSLELLADLIDDECANEFTADCPSFSNLDETYTCESCTMFNYVQHVLKMIYRLIVMMLLMAQTLITHTLVFLTLSLMTLALIMLLIILVLFLPLIYMMLLMLTLLHILLPCHCHPLRSHPL